MFSWRHVSVTSHSTQTSQCSSSVSLSHPCWWASQCSRAPSERVLPGFQTSQDGNHRYLAASWAFPQFPHRACSSILASYAPSFLSPRCSSKRAHWQMVWAEASGRRLWFACTRLRIWLCYMLNIYCRMKWIMLTTRRNPDGLELLILSDFCTHRSHTGGIYFFLLTRNQ